MTHELGKHWPQPARDTVVVFPEIAYTTTLGFEMLSNYSTTIPTGCYEGKMWRRVALDVKGKESDFLCWFDVSDDPAMCSNRIRPLKVLDAVFEPVWVHYANFHNEPKTRQIVPLKIHFSAKTQPPCWVLEALDWKDGSLFEIPLATADFASQRSGQIHEAFDQKGKLIAVCTFGERPRSEALFHYRFEIGTRIRFPKTLEAPADEDQPARVYAEKGETGSITGYNEFEGYWVKSDRWPHAFGAKPTEFELIEAVEFKCPECQTLLPHREYQCGRCGCMITWA